RSPSHRSIQQMKSEMPDVGATVPHPADTIVPPPTHAPNPRRVFISGQKRGVFGRIKRELTRRSAIEAVIGHMKAEGHLGRCYLKGRAGDAANVILSAVGYNLRLVLAWLRIIVRVILLALLRPSQFGQPSNRLLNGRLARLIASEELQHSKFGCDAAYG